MFIWPIQTSAVMVLSQETKKVIVRDVAEKVYEQFKTGSYLENGYILRVANEIAEKAFDLRLVPLPECDGFLLRPKITGESA